MNTDKIYAESIAKEYAPKDSSKIVALRKLDRKAKLPATIFTFTFGIISSLVLGTGMCLAMQVIGSGTTGLILGIIIGIIGFVACGINYPIYCKMLERGKQKYAFEIVELAKEIMKTIKEKTCTDETMAKTAKALNRPVFVEYFIGKARRLRRRAWLFC